MSTQCQDGDGGLTHRRAPPLFLYFLFACSPYRVQAILAQWIGFGICDRPLQHPLWRGTPSRWTISMSFILEVQDSSCLCRISLLSKSTRAALSASACMDTTTASCSESQAKRSQETRIGLTKPAHSCKRSRRFDVLSHRGNRPITFHGGRLRRSMASFCPRDRGAQYVSLLC